MFIMAASNSCSRSSHIYASLFDSDNGAEADRANIRPGLTAWCTPGMGVNLWGASPLCVESNTVVRQRKQALADGKGVSARRGLKEAGAQSYEPTKRNSIQGRGVRASQHNMTKSHGFRMPR